MQKIILEKLQEIETTENVTILFAIESGSRAWGFASPDSDYDVRFVYARKVQDYLALNKHRDVIEFMLDETLDINGWDLDKALRLLYSSNPTIFEWCNSPMVYKTSDFHQQFKNIINDSFTSKSVMYHYLSMAKRNYREYLNTDTVRYKKYLYVIRPLLACHWILKNNTPPPMLFSELVQTQLPNVMHPFVDALLKKKMSKPETAQSEKIVPLNNWIEEQLVFLQECVDNHTYEQKANWQQLNNLFFQTLEVEQ